jgi:hypothetical protein
MFLVVLQQENQKQKWQKKSSVNLRSTSSILVLYQFCNNLSRIILRFWLTVGIIESYLLVLRRLTDIVIWYWKMLKRYIKVIVELKFCFVKSLKTLFLLSLRCGQKRQRPVKARKLNQSIRIDSLAKCFYAETLSYFVIYEFI